MNNHDLQDYIPVFTGEDTKHSVVQFITDTCSPVHLLLLKGVSVQVGCETRVSGPRAVSYICKAAPRALCLHTNAAEPAPVSHHPKRQQAPTATRDARRRRSPRSRMTRCSWPFHRTRWMTSSAEKKTRQHPPPHKQPLQQPFCRGCWTHCLQRPRDHKTHTRTTPTSSPTTYPDPARKALHIPARTTKAHGG